MSLLMKSCPNWENCDANICPLDPDWKLRTHMSGEPICRYLREWAKVQAGSADIAVFKGALSEEAQIRIELVYPDINNTHAVIKSKLNTASRTPSKLQKREFGASIADDRKQKIIDSLETIQPGIRGLL